MRAVVTGCAGFIGSHLSERLVSEGWSVTGIDCFSPTYGTALRRDVMSHIATKPRFEFIEGDVNTIDLRPYVADADVVFHLAARPGVRASWSDFANASDANILATQRVLDAFLPDARARLVFASSSSVYGGGETFPTTESTSLAPISPYGVTKAACEALITAYVSQFGVDAVSLRYFTVYGPRQRSDMAFTKWIRAALRSEPLPLYGDGSAIRDFTYVGDVVDATFRVATADTSGHAIFNVAGGSPARVTDVLDLIARHTGVDLQLDRQARAAGDPDRTGGDTTRIAEATGWAPEWSLTDGIRSQVEWVRSSGTENGVSTVS